MGVLRLSRRAEADLADIAEFTLRNWGEDQAIRYLDDLEACCRMLADRPELGRRCHDVRSGLRRMEHGWHVVFYRQESEGHSGVPRPAPTYAAVAAPV